MAVLVCCGFNSACSSLQIAYNQTDFLLKWWLDDYLDLSTDQDQLIDQAVTVQIKKHRQEELPKALQKIRALRSKLDRPLTIDEGTLIVKDIKTFSRDSINYLLEDASSLVLTLEPKQFTYMENAFKKSNKKFQNDYLSGNAEDRLDKRVEKIIERTESFSGDLNKSQKSQVKDIAKEYLLDMETVYQARTYKQQLILKVLKKINQDRPPASEVKTTLNQLFNEIELGTSQEQKDFEKKRDLHAGIVIAKISEILNDKQRKKAQSKIQSWENDVSVLITQKPKN
ncbi:MAG: DUF6279 family lipoprotein [Betaproteobacteria bacterium]